MSERKTLTITQIEEVKKVGDKQIPKLSFKAKDGDKELTYFTFKTSLFELIKQSQIINADIETSTREWEGQTYTDRRIVQIYVDGQPVSQKGQQSYRGKSPEELEQSARSQCCSYAKDCAIAKLIPVEGITELAEIFYNWVKNNDNKSTPAEPIGKIVTPKTKTASEKTEENMPIGKKIKNITELKSLLMSHKIPTREAYEILSINSFIELADLDEAWEKIKKAKGIDDT
jgi:hypothetical protein